MAFNSGQLPVIIGIMSFFAPLFGLFFQNFYSDSIDPHYMPLKKAIAERTVIVITQPNLPYFYLPLHISC